MTVVSFFLKEMTTVLIFLFFFSFSPFLLHIFLSFILFSSRSFFFILFLWNTYIFFNERTIYILKIFFLRTTYILLINVQYILFLKSVYFHDSYLLLKCFLYCIFYINNEHVYFLFLIFYNQFTSWLIADIRYYKFILFILSN